MVNTLFSWIDKFNRLIAAGVRWVALLMVLVTILVVALRYGFNVGAIALQESVTYMHGILFLLGIPYALGVGAHVRVDLIYSRLTEKSKALVDLFGHLVFLIPVSGFIFFTSLPYVTASWRVWEGSSEVGGLPFIYLLKTLLPVFAVLLFLQGLAEIAKIVNKLRRGEP